MFDINYVLDSFFSSYAPSLSVNLRENRIERMKLLLSRLDNPERSFRTIHIAGSKGKGTVATALSFLLSGSGRKTGLFLSPHVYDIRERFTLSSVFFKDEEYLSALEELKRRIEDFSFPEKLGESRPTTFELYTAYSYILFKRTACEWAVIETGLGGRLDATNTIESEAAVITTIEKEHTKILGDTITLIAGEKAGIIKEGKPTFLFKNSKEAEDKIKRTAEEKHSPLYIFTPFEYVPDKENGIRDVEYSGIKIRLNTYRGDVRLYDIIFSIFILRKLGLIREDIIYDFTSPLFSLPGRHEIREYEKRTFILDGAHTPSSIGYLINGLKQKSPDTLIFSAAVDKDHTAMGRLLVPLFKRVIITGTGKWKKSAPEIIYRDFTSLFPHKSITLLPLRKDALSFALNNTEEHGIIVVTGSFYLLSEIDTAMKERENGCQL